MNLNLRSFTPKQFKLPQLSENRKTNKSEMVFRPPAIQPACVNDFLNWNFLSKYHKDYKTILSKFERLELKIKKPIRRRLNRNIL